MMVTRTYATLEVVILMTLSPSQIRNERLGKAATVVFLLFGTWFAIFGIAIAMLDRKYNRN